MVVDKRMEVDHDPWKSAMNTTTTMRFVSFPGVLWSLLLLLLLSTPRWIGVASAREGSSLRTTSSRFVWTTTPPSSTSRRMAFGLVSPLQSFSRVPRPGNWPGKINQAPRRFSDLSFMMISAVGPPTVLSNLDDLDHPWKRPRPRQGGLYATPPFHGEDDEATKLPSSPKDDDDDTSAATTTGTPPPPPPPLEEGNSKRQKLRRKVRELAQALARKPLIAPMPQAIAAVLKDATLQAVDMAVDEVMSRRPTASSSPFAAMNKPTLNRKTGTTGSSVSSSSSSSSSSPDRWVDMHELVEEAFVPLETSLSEMEVSLAKARQSLEEAKVRAVEALEAVQAAALAQAEGAQAAVVAVEEAASRKALADIYAATAAASVANVSDLVFTDIDWYSSGTGAGDDGMAPPFLGEDQCLVPGEPVVRVEKAPDNSRRIFAGIDILASVDQVWKALTDYGSLQNIVPNLVVNEVLELYPGTSSPKDISVDTSQPEHVQCQELARQMKGALLRQVGGAKVAGIQFSARTTLEVREWPQGLPDFAHFNEEVWQGKSRKERAKDYAEIKLQRYKFPRPFAVSSLPTRDISMLCVENDDGEFRMYQGVWRMQPLPGCAPPGRQAMRLTYAVEVSPRAYLPVQFVEGRIVHDLCTNLKAIRDFVAAQSAAVIS